MEYLAHSSKDKSPAQTYSVHIKGVCDRSIRYAEEIAKYSCNSHGLFYAILSKSSIWHDLGKLDDNNQEVLHDPLGAHRHLPINHVDAGCAKLIQEEAWYETLMVYSHHRGLPNIAAEQCRGISMFRDDNPSIRLYTDNSLNKLIDRHSGEICDEIPTYPPYGYKGNLPVLFRMLLSCLADADHTDTAISYGQAPEENESPELRAEERLAALDQYVSELGGTDERSMLRHEMYTTCRDAIIEGNFVACDSPVGSGKTTAVMAHLLKQANLRNARRVFVILPYTSIIQQSVEIYRKAVVLPDEDPESVVAELHCRADFQNKDTRYLTALWRAPIVVTTAVSFFETLASHRPSSLRRLHELPGSVVFIDEAHNALPVKLLPLAWQWMNVLADEWNCYWVLASGSLVRFWNIAAWNGRIKLAQPTVTELVKESVRKRLFKYERGRIEFRWQPNPISREKLVKWVSDNPGPRLLIVNTVQNAAVIAEDFRKTYGRNKVEHLSTALSPEDRDSTIKCVKSRLQDPSDTDWVLVATSCVEAGVDFSFRTGFRELSSVLSLLQAAGRVNRHGLDATAEIWSFTLQDNSLLKSNPTLENSREVLQDYFNKGLEISPELSSQSLNDELLRNDSCISSVIDMIDDEDKMQFKDISETFQVIDSDSVIAVVDNDLAELIARGGGNWQQLQRKSVSIRRSKVLSWNLKEISAGIFRWTLNYNNFLGYMQGVLEVEMATKETLIV